MVDQVSTAQNPASPGEPEICDLIMKGGVTSGVVYPPAIVELARKYRFKNIGGTSAGAIAAAAAAAAEYGRQAGGFAKLSGLSEEAGGILLNLFQPEPPFRPLFRAFLGVLENETVSSRTFAAAGALIGGHRLAALGGAIPGLILAVLTGWLARPVEGWLLALLVLLFGVIGGVAFAVHKTITKELPAHNYGLCSGLSSRSHQPALTDWLAAKIDDLAGRDPAQPDCRPLTFGDLVGDDADDPNINLVIMTTNLTVGRPHRIPFDQRTFMYSPREFAEIFPPRICSWLLTHSSPVANNESAAPDLRWLPRTEDLPVVVAVRMSLSFPLLLTAVPLWARDYTYTDKEKAQIPERCLFSDGGISSNFPIHFFDSIWPRWPTFGITLDNFDAERHRTQVWLPDLAREGILSEFVEIKTTMGFLWSIIETMRDWRDNMQSVLPGYRERVVHIRLRDGEGGLSLNMPPELIDKLSQFGAAAGGLLRDEFDQDAHRWRRYLVSMARLEDLMEEGVAAAEPHAGAWDGYLEFLQRYAGVAAQYKQSDVWREAAFKDSQEFLALAREWLGARPLRGGKIPRPKTEIRVAPRV